jgi:hypothetical protein
MKNKTFKRLEKKAKTWRSVIANQVFEDFYYHWNLEKICERIIKHQNVIIKYRSYLEQRNIRSCKKYKSITPYEPDRRLGDETYGYESIDSIEGSLNYISDRFGGEFRLTWLLEVPERVALLQNK